MKRDGNSSEGKPQRLAELDAMRGIAAMCVTLYHFNYKYVQHTPEHGALPLLFGWGHHGVSLFFAISGFVISMTLERMDGVASFAWSRFSRLFPVYWAAMAVTMMVVALGGPAKMMVSPQEALANATMLHYWFDIFYLVMALVLKFRLLQKLEMVLAAWLVLHVLQTVTGIFPFWASRMLALEYIPLFAIGIIHYRYYRGLIGWQRTAAWHAALIAIVALSGTSPAIVAFGTIAVFWAMTRGLLRFIAHPLLLWLGAISYPLYLIHQYVGYVLLDHLAGAGLSLLASTGIVLLMVMGMAHMLHIWIENPSQRYLRQLRRPSLAPAE
jgi:peptidoglycan/LPS O-acetylase OafA/YrhL